MMVLKKCSYPRCRRETTPTGRFCHRHQVTANISVPSAPMTVQVREQLESDRAEAIRLRDRRAAAGSAADRVAHLQGRNMERMRVGYAALLESRKTDRELLEPLENAFRAIKAKDRFKHYHEAET